MPRRTEDNIKMDFKQVGWTTNNTALAHEGTGAGRL
jgi:hypothetical protein